MRTFSPIFGLSVIGTNYYFCLIIDTRIYTACVIGTKTRPIQTTLGRYYLVPSAFLLCIPTHHTAQTTPQHTAKRAKSPSLLTSPKHSWCSLYLTQ